MQKIRVYVNPLEVSSMISVSDPYVLNKLRNVLRLKKGYTINIFDGCGKEYIYSIEEISKKVARLKKEKLLIDSPAPDKKLTLAFPLEKEERVDFILQKATELGVWKFIPFVCQRSIQAKPSVQKINRWRKITIEAARQSQRLWIPEILDVTDINDLCSLDSDLKLVGALSGRKLSEGIPKKIKDILIAIGPVGDFSDSEYGQFKTKGFKAIKLSNHLLRTETACAFFVGLVNYFIESK